MTDIFISYSRKNIGDCLEFASALDEAGINYWLDKEGIEGGSKWGQIIPKAVHDSKIVVLLASKFSLNSDNVYNEISLAIERYKRPVVPVLLEAYPEEFTKLDYLVHSLQHIELDNKEGKFGSIIRYLKNKLSIAPNSSIASQPQNAPAEVSSPIATQSGKRGDFMKRTRVTHNHPDGAVVYLEHRQVWVGYADGKIVCTKGNPDKVKDFLLAKFGITGTVL